ncbi:MAG: hypothetical protein ACREJ6_03225 [Candidatus Methylomirabilis sp.]
MDRRTIGMFILNATFGNVGYMGVPFNSVAFGERGMPVVALTIVLTLTITTLLSVTLGLAVMEGGGLPVERVPFAIAVLQSAMPVAATNFVFAQQFGLAVEVTAAGIVGSTVLSLFTLSALLLLLL